MNMENNMNMNINIIQSGSMPLDQNHVPGRYTNLGQSLNDGLFALSDLPKNRQFDDEVAYASEEEGDSNNSCNMLCT